MKLRSGHKERQTEKNENDSFEIVVNWFYENVWFSKVTAKFDGCLFLACFKNFRLIWKNCVLRIKSVRETY